VPNTMTVAGGEIESGVIYDIRYLCREFRCEDENNDEVEIIEGFWTGEVDDWGKLTICPLGRMLVLPKMYLFADEIVSIERVY